MTILSIRVTKRNKLFFLLIPIILCNCTDKDSYSNYHSFKKSEWNKSDVGHFEVPVSDTINPYDIYLELRNNREYEYRNLWMFVSIETPSGNIRQDTVNCLLADNIGNWYGKGFSLYHVEIPYEKSITFPRKGNYIFKIQQGMREDILKGISDIGIRITKPN